MAALLGVFGAWMYLTPQPVSFHSGIRYSVISPTKLEEGYVDADNDLIADPPADPARQIDPETLLFSTLGGDLESEKRIWQGFVSHLAKTTGKQIEHVGKPEGVEGAVTHVKEGTTHVLAPSTGTVPTAVNRAGFVPCFVMAAADGSFGYEMEIIVPADSKVQSPKDLKGKKVTFGSMSSNSAFKAPIVYLWKDFNLRSQRDYDVLQGVDQTQAIAGVCKGHYEAAPVANDLLRREVAWSKEKEGGSYEGKYRSIYKSNTYPPVCFGHPNTLKPETAKQVREAFQTFAWKGSELEEAYKAANLSKFVPVSYKEHWVVVRENDEAMNQLLEQTR